MNQWSTLLTEEDYDKALERTIELFNSDANTPEAKELDQLLPLVMAYEDIHYPIPLPDKEGD